MYLCYVFAILLLHEQFLLELFLVGYGLVMIPKELWRRSDAKRQLFMCARELAMREAKIKGETFKELELSMYIVHYVAKQIGRGEHDMKKYMDIVMDHAVVETSGMVYRGTQATGSVSPTSAASANSSSPFSSRGQMMISAPRGDQHRLKTSSSTNSAAGGSGHANGSGSRGLLGFFRGRGSGDDANSMSGRSGSFGDDDVTDVDMEDWDFLYGDDVKGLAKLRRRIRNAVDRYKREMATYREFALRALYYRDIVANMSRGSADSGSQRFMRTVVVRGKGGADAYTVDSREQRPAWMARIEYVWKCRTRNIAYKILALLTLGLSLSIVAAQVTIVAQGNARFISIMYTFASSTNAVWTVLCMLVLLLYCCCCCYYTLLSIARFEFNILVIGYVVAIVPHPQIS